MRDANEIARDYARSEEKGLVGTHIPLNAAPAPRPRYGRLIGAVMSEDLDNPTVDEDGQNVWEDVAVQPYGEGGLLLLEHQEDNLRTIINTRAYLFLEFRPNDEGE